MLVPGGCRTLWWAGCVRLAVHAPGAKALALTFYGPRTLHVAEDDAPAGAGGSGAPAAEQHPRGPGWAPVCQSSASVVDGQSSASAATDRNPNPSPGSGPPDPPAGPKRWFRAGAGVWAARHPPAHKSFSKALPLLRAMVVADVGVSGLPGWISVAGKGAGVVTLDVWTPRGVEAWCRPPLPLPVPAELLQPGRGPQPSA